VVGYHFPDYLRATPTSGSAHEERADTCRCRRATRAWRHDTVIAKIDAAS